MGISLTKEVEDLYNEKYEMQTKEIENTKKGRSPVFMN
jgi:hypothetical protein